MAPWRSLVKLAPVFASGVRSAPSQPHSLPINRGLPPSNRAPAPNGEEAALSCPLRRGSYDEVGTPNGEVVTTTSAPRRGNRTLWRSVPLRHAAALPPCLSLSQNG